MGKAAPKAKRVAELTDRRTANQRFWRLSDGRVQTEVSVEPTGYRSGKSFKNIDPTVEPTDAKGFALANTTNAARSWFGTDADRLLKFEADGHTVTLGLEGAGKLAPVADGNTVTYKNAVPGADLSYVVGPGRVKENIVLAERPTGPVSFTFTLDAGGLTPKSGKDGSVEFYGEAPNPVLVIPAAFMTDAKKTATAPYGAGYSPAVEQKLTKSGKDWKLTVTPDAKWLAAKERQYPVTVDPTITIAPTPSSAQDVMISSDGPASNYDDNWRLSVGNTSTGSSRALIRFPLGTVPAGTKLDSADLKLYYDQTHTAGDTEVQLEAHRATQPWSENDATWNSANTFTGELSGTSVVVDDGDAGRTAAVGAWPASGNTAYTQYATNQDYLYNKDTVAGDSYTWQPSLPEDGDYQVETHYVPASDRATNTPYTVTYNGGTKAYTVNQQAGTAGVWKTLGTHPFKAGTLGKIVLGDGPASTTTTVLADAVRFTKGGVVTKKPNELNAWHTFPVTKTVQSWIDGTNTNNGFVIKAGDESANGPKGGPRYEGSEFGYAGESANYPKLVLTYGRQGVDLAAPTTIHDTGAELNWSTYIDPSAANTDDDLVEYQVHRSINQTFTPSAATMVSPIAPGTTAFTDTSAVPTKADDPDPFGRAYYYMIAVKTKDRQVLPAQTQLVRLPKAGRTTKVLEASADTTLSSAEPALAHDTLTEGGPQTWISAGNNSLTYGDTRALLKFPALGIPATARVLDATVRLWGTQTSQDNAGAIYELKPLTKDFDETATWTKANASTNWTTPGGDVGATVSDTGSMTNDPARHDWNVTSLAQSWVTTPASQKGVAIKMADESLQQERTLFLSSEGAEAKLHPKIVVTYIDSTTASTYFAPQTPARMTPNTTYTVDFTLTNTTSSAWAAGERELSYTWKLPDGTDVTNGGNQIATPVPALDPGESAALQAQVKTPINSDSGNKRTDYVLGWDVRKISDGSWLSAGTGAIPSLVQNVAVEDPTSNTLGMEKFYSYTGKNTGAGSTVMNNLSAGNSVWSYNAFTNPGRGLTTFARFAYNSLDTSDTVLGAGWSGQAAGPIRMGAPLEFHPKPHPTEIRLPDGDGTTHVFREQPDGSWKAPAGVHYKLAAKPGLDCTPLKDPVPDAWTLTRPDGTRFVFGCDGYLTSTVDNNGNAQTHTYEERKSNNKPTKFLTYITDPVGRQSLTVEYYKKGDASYDYINDSGAKVTGSNLTNSKIYDHVKSMTDISGRKISFYYTDKGLLGQLTDGVGSSQPKNFKFTYDATQGNKNVKLVKVVDPRGNGTSLAYNTPAAGDDPKFHWWTKSVTDRLNNASTYVYQANTSNSKFIDAKVTDAEGRATNYVLDDFGRQVQVTNAKSETTKMNWDADNSVTYIEEANGAKSAFCYDQKTGYPLREWDAETTKSWTSAQLVATYYCDPANEGSLPGAAKFAYTTRLDGYSADLTVKTSPEGRKWNFGYDSFGNLTSVTDPKGVATTTVGDYTTKYEYDVYGQQTRTVDANGNASVNADFEPSGYPKTITDAESHATKFVYDERGQVTTVTNALQKTTTQTYDTFGRPMVSKVPKDQAAGVYITTLAPDYDANDNVTRSTDPAGVPTTAVYDAGDQLTSSTGPDNNTIGRKTAYTYDKVGNLRTTTEPKGVATTTDATDFVTTNHYDAAYQLTSVVDAKGDKVSYEYDNVGNMVTVVDPKKNATADTTDYTSKSTYDLNHRVVKGTDSAGKYTTTVYDKDSLVVAATDKERNKTELLYDERAMPVEKKEPYEGTTVRSTKFEYDQVGNRTKVITPRGVNTSNTEDFTLRTEYDKLSRAVKEYQPYDPADARFNSPNVYTQTVFDAVGQVTKVSAPPSSGETARNETTYTYFDNGSVRTSTDTWDIRTAYEYDDSGRQTTRTLTGAGGSPSRTMTTGYWPDGSMKTRTDAPSAGAERKSFAYAYDANGNTTSINDTSAGAGIDAYTMTYTGLNQVEKVTEALAGEAKKTTSYVYDANGQPDSVTHPDQYSQFTYDPRELVKTVKVGETPTDATPELTEYTYTDRGKMLRETKANKNTVDYAYFLNGALKSTTEKKSGGALVASHVYTYDANGNKAQDVAKKMNADNHSAYLDSTSDFVYDPADRIGKVTKTGSGAGTETYVHDNNANVISQTVKGVSTTFDYDRNRLTTATNGGTAATYNYDAYGRLDNVVSGGKTVEDNTYDGFDHVTEHTKLQPDGSSKTTKYKFDPLDRKTAKTEGTKTTDYNYLGTGGEVLDERVAGEITKSYQYSPWGKRLSQIKHGSDGTEELGVYGYNSHTDAEILTDSTGDTKATYGYTAYGKDDEAEFTGIDKPEAAQPDKEAYNPYRFNSKRWDAASGTYDMGFRDYNPGLNRFTTRDMYNGALADMRLGSDPYTGNRYAFSGGNPVSNVELDGHCFGIDWCESAVDATGDAIADTASGIYMGTGEVFYGLVSNIPDTASYAGWMVDGDCWNGGAGAPGCDYGATFDNWAASQGYNTDKWTYTLPSMVADLVGRKTSGVPSPGAMPKKKTPPAPKPTTPPAPKQEKYGDRDGYISLFKAPWKGYGQGQYDNGYNAADFPDSPKEKGAAYFGRKYSLVDEKYARYYGDGIIEIRIPEDDYNRYFKGYEKLYEGGPEVEVPVPTEMFGRLNSYERLWHK